MRDARKRFETTRTLERGGRLRERVLWVAARGLVHGRRATLVIGKAPAELWHALWSCLATWRYAEA